MAVYGEIMRLDCRKKFISLITDSLLAQITAQKYPSVNVVVKLRVKW